MCKDCGCEEGNKRIYFGAKSPAKSPDTNDGGRALKKISLSAHVLDKNDKIAAQNRSWLKRHNIKSINLISSPGSGKTLLLEKTLALFQGTKKITIITGDQEGTFDALRLQGMGATIKQINTHSSCHLDAQMISQELGESIGPETDLLIIENVGNLVCPAAFDLGEDIKVALLSTAEGEDKPSKYPVLFNAASVVVITKTDLMPHLEWSPEKCHFHIRRINGTAPILMLSAKSGEGMQEWMRTLTTLSQQ